MNEVYKLIIAGSRSWTDRALMDKYLQQFWGQFIGPGVDIVIVSGTARGADKMGEEVSHTRGLGLIQMPANWELHGKSAGYIRNDEMSKIADGCLVCWDGLSKGSGHMWKLAQAKGLDCMLVTRFQIDPVVTSLVEPGKNYVPKQNYQ